MAAKVLGTTRDGAIRSAGARPSAPTPTRWRKERDWPRVRDQPISTSRNLSRNRRAISSRIVRVRQRFAAARVVCMPVSGSQLCQRSKRALQSRNDSKVAAALEEKLDSLWKATEEQQFLELSALSSGVKLEEAAEEKKRQARTQLSVEGPRACALLATLWAAAEEARSSAGDGSSHDGSEQSSRVSTVWRCHAALWACSQAVAKELDTHVADTMHPSADALPSCSQSPSPRGQSASPRGFSSTTPPPGANGNADTEVKVDEVNVDAELKVVDDPSSVSPLARPGSKLSSPFPTSSSSSIPQWETVMGFLAGGGRLSTMSEPRLKELHEPCKQWLLLMLYWLNLTRLLQAKLASTAAADDASSGRWRIELLCKTSAARVTFAAARDCDAVVCPRAAWRDECRRHWRRRARWDVVRRGFEGGVQRVQGARVRRAGGKGHGEGRPIWQRDCLGRRECWRGLWAERSRRPLQWIVREWRSGAGAAGGEGVPRGCWSGLVDDCDVTACQNEKSLKDAKN